MGRISTYSPQFVSTVVGKPVKDTTGEEIAGMAKQMSESATMVYQQLDKNVFAPQQEAMANKAIMEYTTEAYNKTAALKAEYADNPMGYTEAMRQSLGQLQEAYTSQLKNPEVSQAFNKKANSLLSTFNMDGTEWAVKQERQNGKTAIEHSLGMGLAQASTATSLEEFNSIVDNTQIIKQNAYQFMAPEEVNALVDGTTKTMGEAFVSNLIGIEPLQAIAIMRDPKQNPLSPEKTEEFMGKALQSESAKRLKLTREQAMTASVDTMDAWAKVTRGQMTFGDLEAEKNKVAWNPDTDVYTKNAQIEAYSALQETLISERLETNLNPQTLSALTESITDISKGVQFLPSVTPRDKTGRPTVVEPGKVQVTGDKLAAQMNKLIETQTAIHKAYANGEIDKKQYNELNENIMPIATAALNAGNMGKDNLLVQARAMVKADIDKLKKAGRLNDIDEVALSNKLFMNTVANYNAATREYAAAGSAYQGGDTQGLTVLGDSKFGTSKDILASAYLKTKVSHFSEINSALVGTFKKGDMVTIPIVRKDGSSVNISGTYYGIDSLGYPIMDLDKKSEEMLKI